MTSIVTEKSEDVKYQKTNPYQLPKAFEPFRNIPMWLASDPVKKPVSPVTGESKGYNKPETWGTFDQVLDFIADKPGFVPAIACDKSHGLVAIDLDHVIVDRKTLPWAQSVIDRMAGAYLELSSNGDGYHIYALGIKPGSRKSKSNPSKNSKLKDKFEIYDSNHVMRLTGNQQGFCDTLTDLTPVIEEVYFGMFPPDDQETQQDYVKTPPMSDDEVLAYCRKTSKDKFEALFDKGDTRSHGNDDSAADMALACIFARYTQDIDQIERLMRQSKLVRHKWDEHATYLREFTITNALKLVEPFQPSVRAALKVFGIGEFLKKEIPPRPVILSPWLRQKNLIMISAWRGVGKTFFGLNLGYAIASGGKFLEWQASQPYKVLLIDGEMPGETLQERLSNIVQSRENTDKKHPPGDEYLQILSSDMQEEGLPYLDTIEGQQAIDDLIEKADVIILDNLSTLTCSPENENDAWLSMQQWILSLRRRGKTIIMIHHEGKSGSQRGNSKKEDILDVTISLKHPKDYSPEQGAKFELHFGKSRGLSGSTVAPLLIEAVEKDGILEWKSKELARNYEDRILELLELGMKNNDIYAELGISRAQYYRIKRKMETHKI